MRAEGDNQNVRIAMLSYHTCPLATLGGKDTGGMNVYVRDLTRELGRVGIGVDVFTRSQDEHVPHVLHDLGYGNRVVHIPAGPETHLDKDEMAQLVPRYVEGILDFAVKKRLHYDLIHSHYWLSGLAGLELRTEWQKPLIHMFHTLAAMKNRVARSSEEIASELRMDSEIRLLREANRIIAPTQAEMAQIQWLYRVETQHVTIIPPGVDLAHFYPIAKDEAKEYIGRPLDPCMLLYVGRVEPLKGIDTLIEALAMLKKRGSLDERPFCLAIIGGDPHASPEQMSAEMDRLKRLSTALGLEENVIFLGQRSQDSLPYYYSAAELVIVPSHYESFGMVALEAMACGTPVVASETGGLAFLVQDGETGFHVPAADPKALADRLLMLMQDPALRERLGRQASAYARGYDWSIIAEKVIELYNRVLSE